MHFIFWNKAFGINTSIFIFSEQWHCPVQLQHWLETPASLTGWWLVQVVLDRSTKLGITCGAVMWPLNCFIMMMGKWWPKFLIAAFNGRYQSLTMLINAYAGLAQLCGKKSTWCVKEATRLLSRCLGSSKVNCLLLVHQRILDLSWSSWKEDHWPPYRYMKNTFRKCIILLIEWTRIHLFY